LGVLLVGLADVSVLGIDLNVPIRVHVGASQSLDTMLPHAEHVAGRSI